MNSNTTPLRPLINDLESLAFEMPAPNEFTPKFIALALQMKLCIRPPGSRDKDLDGAQPKSALPGLTPRGTSMPQSPEEWAYLGDLYERGLLEAQAENSRLRIKIHKQAQRLEKQRRTITGMLETPDEY